MTTENSTFRFCSGGGLASYRAYAVKLAGVTIDHGDVFIVIAPTICSAFVDHVTGAILGVLDLPRTLDRPRSGFSVLLGLVPREYSTRSKTTLLGISKSREFVPATPPCPWRRVLPAPPRSVTRPARNVDRRPAAPDA